MPTGSDPVPDHRSAVPAVEAGTAPFARLGLRERKRLQAMRRIQTVALDQFEEHGFDQVTIEHIAEHSEVSPSTVYRYFGTKEMIVVWDEYDPVAIQAVADALGEQGPMDALRAVLKALTSTALEQDSERIQRRLRLSFATPSIAAAATVQAFDMATLIARVLTDKLGSRVDALDVRVFSHAFVGAFLGALQYWHDDGFATPFGELIDRALAAVEHGLPLD